MFRKLLIVGALAYSVNAVELEKKWESQSILKVPESVILDKENNQLYVSNVNGNPSSQDGNGFISILDLNGNVKNLKFSEGMNAPKGMAILNNKLYVSDIDTLRVIDINNGNIIQNYKIDAAKFLNDVVVTKNGTVYVSDFSGKNKAIYKIFNGKVTKWLNNKQLLEQRPNGLWLDDSHLVIGTKGGTILRVDYKTKKVKVFNSNIGKNGIDGILPFDENRYITSDWAGRVFISDEKNSIKILDNTDDKINAADIWYDPDTKKLYIPTFFDNRILSFEVK